MPFVIGFVIGAAALILLAAIVGAIGNAAATALERRRFPPPGRLIDVGGYRLHLRVSGDHPGPTVVIETGRGNPTPLWSLVTEAVAGFARVVTYDRPGYGWSDPLPAGRPTGRISEDLHTALQQAGVPGPYVLVGHSLGGLYVRLFADRYPAEVAGMVLVDARHESCTAGEPPRARQLDARVFRLAIALGRLGLFRLLTRLQPGMLLGGPKFDQRYPPAVRPLVRAVMLWPELWPASFAETKGFTELDGLVARTTGLGDRPLVVLTRGRADTGGWGFTEAEQATAWQAWLAGQAALTRLSTRSRQVIVEDCGHQIMTERPDVIVQAIREIIE